MRAIFLALFILFYLLILYLFLVKGSGILKHLVGFEVLTALLSFKKVLEKDEASIFSVEE
jgi:hypothetical protein